MKLRNLLTAFACDFVSFLIETVDLSRVNSIILFGSVARGTATKKSDVDLFIDTIDKRLSKQILALTKEFYDSNKYTGYWKLLGIENEIKCIAGELKKWKLRRSIISEGITLYGKYLEEIKGKLFVLFSIEVKGKKSRKLAIWRRLYGYRQKVGKKVYLSKGLIKEVEGEKLGPSVFVVPIGSANKVAAFLRQNKIRHSLIELQSDML